MNALLDCRVSYWTQKNQAARSRSEADKVYRPIIESHPRNNHVRFHSSVHINKEEHDNR